MKKIVLILLCLMLTLGLFAGCSAGNDNAGPIKIATKPMTEQFITAEMLKLLIEQETGVPVEITKGIGGGTSNIQPALLKGDFDLYTEYTGTAWLTVLNREDLPDDETMFAELKKEYEEQFGLTWIGWYGFNNTYALAVRKQVADQYQLVTCSDLVAAAPELVFGGNTDFFERADGYNALLEAYGYNFGRTMDLDIGLRYTALENGEIDITNAFTTDPQLSVDGVVVLEDDKHHFKSYYASTVVRQDALEKYPGLEEALLKMNDVLTDSEMSALSYQLEEEDREEADIAREYLTAKGLLAQE